MAAPIQFHAVRWQSEAARTFIRHLQLPEESYRDLEFCISQLTQTLPSSDSIRFKGDTKPPENVDSSIEKVWRCATELIQYGVVQLWNRWVKIPPFENSNEHEKNVRKILIPERAFPFANRYLWTALRWNVSRLSVEQIHSANLNSGLYISAVFHTEIQDVVDRVVAGVHQEQKV